MSHSTWQITTPCVSKHETPFVINRRSHDQLHEAGLKFEAWMFLEYCRLWPSRLAEPARNEWVGMNLLYRDSELTDALFQQLYYSNSEN